MKVKRKIAISAGLLTAVSVMTVASAAQAQNLGDLLRNVLGNNNSNYGNNQSFSNPTAHQTQTMVNLNTKRNNLDDLIRQALVNGQISSQQAVELRAQLRSNADLQNSYTNDGNFTAAEAQTLLSALSSMETTVQSAISLSVTSQVQPTTYGNGGYFGNGNGGYSRNWDRNHRNNGNNLDRIQGEVLSRLQQGQAERRLSNREYSNFKREFDSIATLEAQLRISGGRLTTQESGRVLARLNSLDSSIVQQMQSRQISGRWTRGGNDDYRSDHNNWRNDNNYGR